LTIPAALTIDHIHHDGAKHRRQLPDARDLYQDIIAQVSPPESYAVLCATCHNSKTARGECEHRTEARALFGLAN
jgi:hypothetical protein